MSEPIVYDKAKYHYGGDFPEDLSDSQAFVHTGLYLGWIIERKLYSEEFAQQSKEAIDQFLARKLTGPQVYESWDGCLIDDMLSDEGNAFSQAYFDFENGSFLTDYEAVLSKGLPSMYHVEDTWANYDAIRPVIDRRFSEWKRSPDSVKKRRGLLSKLKNLVTPATVTSQKPDHSVSVTSLDGLATPFTTLVIVGHSRSHLLWQLDTWSEIATALAPIVALCPEIPSVRTTQAAVKGQPQPKFGRLTWNEQSHQKWTHGVHSPESSKWSFYSTEIWSPSWNICAKAHRSPDLYFHIENAFIVGVPFEGQHNQLFQVSLPSSTFQTNHATVDRAVREIAERIEASIVAKYEAPWLAQGDSVQDCFQNRFKYSGIQKDRVPDLSKMKGSWTSYPVSPPLS